METYDVHFNSDENSNSKGFRMNAAYCMGYIKENNGTNNSFFADYKGGIVSIVCNETGEMIYNELIY